MNILLQLSRTDARAKPTCQKRGGIRRRLKNMSLHDCCKLPALPSILLCNAQSLYNKLHELEAWAKFKHKVRVTCLPAFTKTWLSDSDWDKDLSFSGFGIPL